MVQKKGRETWKWQSLDVIGMLIFCNVDWRSSRDIWLWLWAESIMYWENWVFTVLMCACLCVCMCVCVFRLVYLACGGRCWLWLDTVTTPTHTGWDQKIQPDLPLRNEMACLKHIYHLLAATSTFAPLMYLYFLITCTNIPRVFKVVTHTGSLAVCIVITSTVVISLFL